MTKLIFNVDAEEDFDDTENANSFYEKKYGICMKKACIRGKEIEVSGECVYNFGKRYEKLKKIINEKKDIDNKEELYKTLELCRKLHHSLPNIMVLPTNGGLNILKGQIYSSKNKWRVRKGKYVPNEWFDRPDLFVCYINDYYEKKQNFNKYSFKEIGEFFSNGIFTWSIIQGENFTVLLDVLDSFNGINDFCSYFYQINDRMLKGWLKGKDFLVIDDIEKYLHQAFDFWKLQMKYIFKMLLKEDVCIVINGDDIKEYVQGQLSEYTYKNQLILERSEDGKDCYVLRKKEHIS